MTAKLYNLARMSTATTGTGTITLGSAASSYLTFAQAGVQDGDQVTYAIVDGTSREIGRGTYTSSGTTLSRDVILNSTNSGSAISLSGSAEVFITAAAEDIGGLLKFPGYVASTWYIPFGQSLFGSTPSSALDPLKAYFIPGFIVGASSIHVDSLGVRCGAAGTTNIQLALYSSAIDSSGNQRPASLVCNTANIANTATGVQSGTFTAASVAPGMYWFTFQQNDSTAKYAVISNASSVTHAFAVGSQTVGNLVAAAGATVSGLSLTNTFGTWPSTLGGSSFTEIAVNPNNLPAFGFRVSSVP